MTELDLVSYYTQRGGGCVGQIPAPRYVTVSPSGKYVIAIFVTPNCVGTSGHTALFRRDPTALVWERDLIAAQSGHPAWAYDSESNEVFVHVGSDTFRMTRLSDGTSTDLLHLANRCSCSWVRWHKEPRVSILSGEHKR